MIKHSPAPWYWTKNGKWQEGSGKWLASQTGMVLDYSGCGSHKCDVTEEDARLIAASPTMYEYIIQRANEGDAHAAEIIASI